MDDKCSHDYSHSFGIGHPPVEGPSGVKFGSDFGTRKNDHASAGTEAYRDERAVRNGV